MLKNGRASIEEYSSSLKLSIPSRKNWVSLVFATLWLIGWIYALSCKPLDFNSEGSEKLSSDNFYLLWMIGWTGGGLYVAFLLLWGFFGREIIVVENGVMSIKRSLFGIGMKRSLNSLQIRNIHFEKVETGLIGARNKTLWGPGPGKIVLDYGFRTFSFGLGIDDAEANYIAELLKRKITN
jgi:hypothetical protein